MHAAIGFTPESILYSYPKHFISNVDLYTVNNYLKHNVVMDGDMFFSTEGRFDHGEEGGERSSA